VVDTFGLEYVCNPRKAIAEMKRVCRPNGLILVLASGLPGTDLRMQWARWTQPKELAKHGHFSIRNWDQVFDGSGLEVIDSKKFNGGSIYLYIFRNKKVQKKGDGHKK